MSPPTFNHSWCSSTQGKKMKEPSLRMVPIILVMLRDLEMIGVAGNLAHGQRDITKIISIAIIIRLSSTTRPLAEQVVLGCCNRVCCPHCQQPKVLPKQHREPKTHFDEAIIQFSDTFTWASKISRQRGGKRPNSNTDMIQAKPMFSVGTISLFGLKCRDWPIIISVFFNYSRYRVSVEFWESVGTNPHITLFFRYTSWVKACFKFHIISSTRAQLLFSNHIVS